MNCLKLIEKVAEFFGNLFLPPNTIFLLSIIIRQESAEAALNLRYMNKGPHRYYRLVCAQGCERHRMK